MKEIYILAKNKKTYFNHRLLEELGLGEFHIINPWESENLDEKLNRLIDGLLFVRTSGVYGDEVDLNFLKSLHPKIRVVNPLRELHIFRRKSQQYKSFQENDLPHLPWIYLRDQSLLGLESFLNAHLSMKYLIKPDRGQGGRGIKVFHRVELLKWFRESEDKDYVLQPFIEDYEEFRLFFIRNEKFWTLKRSKSSDSPCANFNQGGGAELVLNENWGQEFLEEILSKYYLDYGAVDIMKMGKKLIIIEINTMPGIEQLEKITQENVTKLLIQSLCQ